MASAAMAVPAAADTSSAASRTATAPGFRQSVGVNAAPSWFDTPYDNWTTVLSRIREMGATNIRASALVSTNAAWNRKVWGRLDEAVAAGIRLNLLIGFDCSPSGTIDPCIEAIRTRVPASGVASVEWPNEHDISNERAWASRLVAWGRDIYTKMKADPATRRIQVLGPSLARKYSPARLNNLSAYMDAGNLHPYTGGLSPTPQHMRAERLRMATVAGAKPRVATEAGFHTVLRSAGASSGTNEATAANYTVRMLLEHFLSGVQRTYLFQMLDHRYDPSDPVANFGLLRHDGTPRKAFTAVKNLMALVGTEGPSRLAPLRYRISGRTSDVRHFAVAQADGSYLLFLWRTASVWNRDLERPVAVAPKPLSLSLPTASAAAVGSPLAGTVMSRLKLGAKRRTTIKIAGRPLVLRVRTDRATSATS